MSIRFKTIAIAVSVLGLGFCVATSIVNTEQAIAQQPLYSPEDIPLDVNEIFISMAPAENYGSITQNIITQLSRNHYQEISFDDNFSTDLLDSYIKMLDPSRIYFTTADLKEFEHYRYTLDNLLQDGDIDAGYHIFNRYHKRLIERLVYSLDRIEEDTSPFDFTLDESIIVDREEAPWAQSTTELQDLWRKRVKSNYLGIKTTDESDDTEIRIDLSERLRAQLSRVLKVNALDVYQRYMDAMTMTFDPHTQYYAPRAAENFNMSMRLSLEGIGAVLTTEDEYTQVVSIVSGGPADLAGELQPADRITAVAQGDENFVNVVGWRVDDVVQLIRGAKGSVVRLNVLPENALQEKVIKITRDTVKLEDSSAKKEIVEVDYEGGTFKIGVIELPTFYIDFEALQNRDPNYRSSTKDVQMLIEELKTEGVDGIVMDLRRNGGGSLSEANALVGLFITRGPTVQVRDAEGNNIVQGDSDASVTYSGPLAVLVNKLSASASEIFAGAIQDYQRGIILGSQTFGKGTVQELISMREGQMKITRAKFYRISGESTQHRGVTPDIIFPDLFDSSEDIGESSLPSALPWDTIEANYFRTYADYSAVIPTLREKHEARLDTDPDFNFIREQIRRTEENMDKNELTLNEVELLKERQESDDWRLTTANIRRVAKGQTPYADLDELDGVEDEEDVEVEDSETLIDENQNQLNQPADSNSNDSASVNMADQELDEAEEEELEEDEEPDPYLVESGKILLDLIRLQDDGSVNLATQ